MSASHFLSPRAATGLAARGVQQSPDHRADRAALDELLRASGRPTFDAAWQAEVDLGDTVGPLVEPGAAINFFAGQRATWLALGPSFVLRRRLFAADLPKELVPLGRSIPLVALPRGWPVWSEQPDRLVRTTAIDDYAIDALGTVFVRGYSTSGALVPVARSHRALLERLGILFGLSAGSDAPMELRTANGMGERLSASLGAERSATASDDLQTWWLGEGVTIGEDRSRAPGATTLFTSSVPALAEAIDALAEQRVSAKLRALPPGQVTIASEAAPPAYEGLRLRFVEGPEAEGALDVVRTGSAVTIVQERRHAGRVMTRETLSERERKRVDHQGVAASLRGALSPRATAFLQRRRAIRDPSRTMSAAALTEALARHGITATAPVLAFEETFGGIAIPSDEGETFWFGAALELMGGSRPRPDRVAVGAYPGGTYWMDVAGRIIVDDGVVDAFVIADDARRLFERFAIGQEYPQCAFAWEGRFAVEMVENIAEALAKALEMPVVPELSDTCQATYATPDGALALWSPPAFAEMSVAPCVAVSSSFEAARPLLEALRAHFAGVGVSVSLGPKVQEVWPEGPPPKEPEGIRYERWDEAEPRGAITLTPEGGLTQWIAREAEIRVERLDPSLTPLRARYRRPPEGA